MKILVTGASGFVGRHVVSKLLNRGHRVVAVARNLDKAKSMPWFGEVNFIACDIHDPKIDTSKTLIVPDILIHLAWAGLSDYKDPLHLDKNLPNDSLFLKKMVLSGTKHILVTGTCQEYGMQSGTLSEDMPAEPTTPYAQAKNKLREFLQELQTTAPFTLQWVRLFYTYGLGQNQNGLIAQLNRAIKNKETTFNMSGGEQIRDFLPIETVASYLTSIAEHPECSGIINCCSGQPIKVRELVEKKIAEINAKINLNLGYYPYPDYEPMAFWGDNTKILSVLKKNKIL